MIKCALAPMRLSHFETDSFFELSVFFWRVHTEIPPHVSWSFKIACGISVAASAPIFEVSMRWFQHSTFALTLLFATLCLSSSALAQDEGEVDTPEESQPTTVDSDAPGTPPPATDPTTTEEALEAAPDPEPKTDSTDTQPPASTPSQNAGAEAAASSDTTSTEPTPGTGTIVRAAPPKPAPGRVQIAWNSEQPEFDKRYLWNLKIGGYIRAQFTAIEDDPDEDLFGRNDGFIMANARLTLEADMRRTLGVRLQFDGAVDRAIDGADRPVSEVSTRLRDAVIWWEPLRFTRLVVGQQKPDFDVEEQFSTNELLFIDRSLVSRGVQGVEGFNVDGLGVEREVGAVLTTRPLYFASPKFDEPRGFGLGYSLGVTNGQSANFTRNDNDKLAYYGRLELWWADMVRLGAAGYLNEKTVGVADADQLSESLVGITADLTFKWAGITAIGSFVQTDTSYDAIDVDPSVTARGFQAQLAYQEPFFGFQPAFRISSYDPSASVDGQSNDTIFANDAQTHYTIGLNYNPSYPIKLMVNYTITDEEAARELKNNRLSFLLQATW